MSTTGITNVTVLGTGVLGSQIAFQTAYSGFTVTAYDINDDALAAARTRFEGLVKTYEAEVEGAKDGKAAAAFDRIRLTSDLADSVKDADLVIEAVPEVLDLKKSIYTELGAVAPEHTIFATNSSTLLPSMIKDSTGRADRFLALHFANRVWQFNTAEVMGTSETDPAVFDKVVAFAEEIHMVPIILRKEKAGYVLNSILVPWLDAAMELAAGDFAEPADVDRTWRIATGSPMGPFQILDVIGMQTPYNISLARGEEGAARAAWLKENYIDKGKMGMASGEGFYKYN